MIFFQKISTVRWSHQMNRAMMHSLTTFSAQWKQHLKLAAIETHVADARTCCLNPATSTHRQMNDEQLKEAGVPAELIRISLGLEDKEDLIADISNALDAIYGRIERVRQNSEKDGSDTKGISLYPLFF